MEEISWYVGARITRNGIGAVHWFVESSDGLSHGHLVDEGIPTGMMKAITDARAAVFYEFVRLYNEAGDRQARSRRPNPDPPAGLLPPVL